MLFSSISSLIIGSRLLISVISSTEMVPPHNAFSMRFCSASRAAMSFSSCSNSIFSLYVFFVRVVLLRVFFSISRLLFNAAFCACSSLVCGVVAREIFNNTITFEYKQVVYNFIHEIAVVTYDNDTAWEILKIFFKNL